MNRAMSGQSFIELARSSNGKQARDAIYFDQMQTYPFEQTGRPAYDARGALVAAQVPVNENIERIYERQSSGGNYQYSPQTSVVSRSRYNPYPTASRISSNYEVLSVSDTGTGSSVPSSYYTSLPPAHDSRRGEDIFQHHVAYNPNVDGSTDYTSFPQTQTSNLIYSSCPSTCYTQFPYTASASTYQTSGQNNNYLWSGPAQNHPSKTFHNMEFASSSQDMDLQDELDSNGTNDAKKKSAKKRKKKGVNEPQKPVSAYALFFRDTQAAIKAENPNATFGEISKIVASMWDSLSEESKQVYKQKTETAKRDYLKQLASYRANLISKGGFEADEDSQPLSMLKMQMNERIDVSAQETNLSNLPPPPKLQIAPNIKAQGLPMQVSASFPNSQRYSPTLTTMQAGTEHGVIPTKPIVRVVTSPGTPPPPIQLRNIVPKVNSPVTILQSKPGQVIKVIPAHQMASITTLQSGKSRIIKMSDMLRPVPGYAQDNMQLINHNSDTVIPPDREVLPILQTIAEESGTLLNNYTPNALSGIIDLDPPESNGTTKPRMCVREGCANPARSDPQWNGEYCSSECVINHCRDVFDAWSSTRQVSASVM